MEMNLRLLCGSLLLIFAGIAQTDSPSRASQLLSTRDIDARRTVALKMQIAQPFPKTTCRSTAPPLRSIDSCVLGKLDYALAALWLSDNANEVAQANDEIANAIKVMHATRAFTDLPDPANPGHVIILSNYFHFTIAPLLFRIDSLFGPNSHARFANRLQPAVHQQILALFSQFVRSECPLSQANPSNTWMIYGSENKQAMQFSTCWSGAQLLVNDHSPLASKFFYADGSKPRQQLAAWTAYFKAYEGERAKRGMFVEYFSVTYTKYTLMNFYNLYDFTADGKLKTETGKFLNLWWADWAQEQLDGFHGGAKTRVYPKSLTDATPLASMPWLYFNLGPYADTIRTPATMPELTSDFVPNPIIADIALDVQGRGTYETFSRRVGLRKPVTPSIPFIDYMDYRKGGIYRYTYVTPELIMGTSMYPRLLPSAWSAENSQNRFNDLLLSSGKRIAAVPSPLTNRDNPEDDYRAYNDTIAVQNKGVQIIAPLPRPYSRKAGGMQVWYSPGLTPIESHGWTFFRDSAFVAVRPVKGDFSINASEPNWLICSVPSSAVIIEAVPKHAYASFQAFKNAMIASRYSVHGKVLSFTGLGKSGTFVFTLDGSELPRVDGTTINLTPPYAFKSPFINESWGSGKVRITKGDKTLNLDFSNGG